MVEPLQGSLFHESLAMTDPRPLDPEQRVALLDDAYDDVMTANGGTVWLIGGPETDLLWQATLASFANGIWVATILSAQATCERTLAGLMNSVYAVNKPPRGWESWGLGRLINHLRVARLVRDELLDQVQWLCDERKPYGHWRRPLEPGALQRVVFDAQAAGITDHPEVIKERHVAQLAFIAARTTLRIHFGDLSRPNPL